MLLLCMSHSPLMLTGIEATDPAKHAGFYAGVADCARALADYRPELLVVFGPDHFNGLFYDLMPAYCIGVEAESTRDWGLPADKLDVPRELALACVRQVQRAGVDVAISYRMKVDHGTTIPLHKLTGGVDRYPVLPIVINCAADPRPSFKRVRLLGEAVGSFLATLGEKRIAVIGSGGLSHDPPTPRIAEAPVEVAARLIDRRTLSKQDYDTQQGRVIEACRVLARGGKSILPPSRDWDRKFLTPLLAQKLEAFDDWSDAEVDREAGFGGHEVRCWLAAFAAMKAAGAFSASERFHAMIPEWATGMAIVTGAHKADEPVAAPA